MPVSGQIKPTDKTIKTYHAALQGYSDERVTHEGATETAFQRLLADTAKSHGWFLIPKLAIKRGGKQIIPDGTLRDEFSLHRGYWEAKDTDDNLTAEIVKKTAKSYPLTNTIFEDTRRAVLFQNGAVAFEADLQQPQQLADLLNAFYAFTEPDIEGFEQAVDEFKERVPELALALAAKITQAHSDNPKFQDAFDGFYDLCRTALNPNLSSAAIDEMLIQHLLTERLIRKIFDNPEFSQRNVIAIEVEKVIAALVSKSFNRDAFLKSLDRFYRAIENAARILEDFSEKQHFLNTVYERFFQGYSVKTADTHGIVYTPQEIVDFMCASVVEVLKTEFDMELGDKRVQILDPCTGTGNFLVNLLHRIPKRDLPRMYREQLFANEVMLLPYYIAALNIEHAYFELTGDYEPFEGLCFVDTLDLAENRQLSLFTEENTARVAKQKKAPITVVIGNPPYNMSQQDENDQNRNRKYPVVDGRLAATYVKDSSATLRMQLYDPYVKFIRWATDRLNGRDGIVCFVTNNSFVDQVSFDGMRKHLRRDFFKLYHLDLHGNVRRNPKLSGTTHNVFGIQVGVGITIAIRRAINSKPVLKYVRVDESWRRENKLAYLKEVTAIGGVKWKTITPDNNYNWIQLKNTSEFHGHIPIALPKSNDGAIFLVSGPGVETNRDDVVYDFNQTTLCDRVERVSDEYNKHVDQYRRKGRGKRVEDLVDFQSIDWSSTLKIHLKRGEYAEFSSEQVRNSAYRPFTKKWHYFDEILNERPGLFRSALPNVMCESENSIICCMCHTQLPFTVQITNCITNRAIGGRAGQCLPFYLYGKNGEDRRENISDWALDRFRLHYKSKKLSKWDIFFYTYGLLHNPGYRGKFAENLKRELPRIPLAPDFKAFTKAGRALADLHLKYEQSEEYQLGWNVTPGVPLSYRVEKLKLTKDKTAVIVNPSLTLSGIPPEAFEYRLGNRSALEWVIDQYQVTEDKRSGIRSDPNRADDPEYIVRLIGQVTHVSVETVRIVNSLPDFS